jgi:6-phosphogluconolactonase/glucosamine-6-phosphate isomerase/deaminase
VDVSEPTMPVTAQYQDRPANRVTLTPVVFNAARMIAFMAAGEKKAETLVEVLSDTHTRNPVQYPAQRITPKHGRLIWLVDESAASKLPNYRAPDPGTDEAHILIGGLYGSSRTEWGGGA